jgi:predicted GNAT family acetyltransferase
MVDEGIVAEAYAVIWSGERAEIATVTHPQHRGRGYATVLCASLIKACEGVDLSTYWNCDEDNGTSVRLATRLGYTDVQQYRLLHFERQSG